MINIGAKPLFFLTFLLFQSHLSAQQLWSKTKQYNSSHEQLKSLKQFEILQLDVNILKNKLATKSNYSKQIIELPIGGQVLMEFEIRAYGMMEAALADKYPHLSTYYGHAINDPSMQVRLNWNTNRLYAYINTSQKTILIDPLEGKENIYVVYDENNTEAFSKLSCGTLAGKVSAANEKNETRIGDELRIIRSAFATTGEFARERVARTDDTFEAVMIMTNRLNAIFERDLAIRFVLVENNDKIIFENATTDPYENVANSLLSKNIEVLNDSIGRANYDLGHIFTSRVEGGVAGVAIRGSICTSNAASGVSSFAGNDGNFLNTLAHEIGHQLGASHTWNKCGDDNSGQRSGRFAVEPGSGSTIMSYAGLCGSDNISSGFDFFHSVSINQINDRLNAASCYDREATGNTPPEVSIAHPNGLHIPINTPFELTAIATDADGDRLTYSWEQLDTGPSTAPEEPEGNAPSFKALPPSSSSDRIFPNFFSQILNTSSRGETLPTYARRLKFGVIVRDNNENGGGSAQDDFFFRSSTNADGFMLLSQDTREEWEIGSTIEITWNVGGSNLEPVNCQAVDILLSYNNGNDGFPDTLAKAVPNTGSATIIVPNRTASSARLKIKASNNIFFDYSDSRFKIVEAAVNTDSFLANNDIKIFPNPSDGLLFVTSERASRTLLHFSLWNLQGQQLLERAEERTFNQIFDLSTFAKGVYFLKITSEEGTALEKIVLD
ncbi:MAG: reprolysin-like metallopeptidase [Bacteroidota bacterium]